MTDPRHRDDLPRAPVDSPPGAGEKLILFFYAVLIGFGIFLILIATVAFVAGMVVDGLRVMASALRWLRFH